MKGKSLIVIIAHPVLGRIARLHVSNFIVHFAVAGIVIALIVVLGLSANYFKMSEQVVGLEELQSNYSALQKEFTILQETYEGQTSHLESLGTLANQVSIAYGVRRHTPEVDLDVNSQFTPMFNGSLSQFGRLRAALSDSQRIEPGAAWMANSTPSIWPVKGFLTSSFGMRNDPFKGNRAFHAGIDIGARNGAPIVATADGYVSDVGWNGGYGRCVKIQHGRNGYTTVYGHMKEYLVGTGQTVRRGEVIGFAGNSGRSTGRHLHYEVQLRGNKINPYKFLRQQQPKASSSWSD